MPKVFIGVGHGGKDPGAVSGGFIEADLNLDIALACQKDLMRHDVAVGISRVKDENDPLYEEIKEANAFKPEVAIEIHLNAGGGDGFEVYHQNNPKSIELAKAIEKEVLAIGQNSRGLKYSSYFGWTREVKAPAVLLEGAFIDSKDREFIDTLEKRQALGVAYAKGVLAYLGIPYKEPPNELYRVQVGAFSQKENAENYKNKLIQQGHQAYIVKN